MAAKNRETILLVVVAVVGLAGLAILQFSRKSPANRSADRALIQAQNRNDGADAQALAPIQKIPGELLRTSEDPEQDRPFRFLMSKYSQGAIYELDMGDGSPRKAFADGAVVHTFRRTGDYYITLYARYEGQEVKLDTLHKVVAHRKVDAVPAPIIDF